MVPADFHCVAKQSRSSLGLVPSEMWFASRPFESQSQNQRREHCIGGNEHHEKSCEGKPESSSVAPQENQHRVTHSKRHHKEKDGAERRGAQGRMAIRTNDR